jgi:hypothetical protein
LEFDAVHAPWRERRATAKMFDARTPERFASTFREARQVAHRESPDARFARFWRRRPSRNASVGVSVEKFFDLGKTDTDVLFACLLPTKSCNVFTTMKTDIEFRVCSKTSIS